MKTVMIDAFNQLNAIKVSHRELPQLKENEVKVAISHAGFNRADYLRYIGKPKFAFGTKKPNDIYPGSDFVGDVIAVGSDVMSFKVGDHVYGDTSESGLSAFAEEIHVPENLLAIAPKNLVDKDIACLPMAASTAYLGILDANVNKGNCVLVYGASGGVGRFVVEILMHQGVHVTAVASNRHFEDLSDLGVKEFVSYEQAEKVLKKKTYDAVIVVNGKLPLKKYIKTIKKHQNLVVVGGSFAQIIKALLFGKILGLFYGRTIKVISSKPATAHLDYVRELAEMDVLHPQVSQVYDLSNVQQLYKDYYLRTYSERLVLRMK